MDKNAAGVQDVLTKIETFSDTYRAIGQRLHELIMETAPGLQPRLWYGMPGYALKAGGPVVLFFREDTYVSFGLTDSTNLSKLGDPASELVGVAWYLSALNEKTEARVVEIVRSIAS